MTRHERFAASLAEWQPLDPTFAVSKRSYLKFLEQHQGFALRRDGGPEHITASCFVFSPDLSHVLLCFHRKGQFWVQLGGHIEEGDFSVPDAALREAREESGLANLAPLGTLPVDLDRHELASAFGRCAAHWDVGYAAIAPMDSTPIASDESEDVRWWPVKALPENVPPGFENRLSRAVLEVAGRQLQNSLIRAARARAWS